MKAIAKLFAEFIAWRWAPAVALLAASMLYVIVVVGVVPSEILIPVANAKFAPKSLAGTASTAANASDNSPTSLATAGPDNVPMSAPPTPQLRNQSNDFGRRGFSPRLDRPEAPAPPPPPPQPAVPVVPSPAGPIGGVFSRIQNALRPGAAAAQAIVPPAAQPAAPADAPASPAPEPAATPGVPGAAPNGAPGTPGTPAAPGEPPPAFPGPIQ